MGTTHHLPPYYLTFSTVWYCPIEPYNNICSSNKWTITIPVRSCILFFFRVCMHWWKCHAQNPKFYGKTSFTNDNLRSWYQSTSSCLAETWDDDLKKMAHGMHLVGVVSFHYNDLRTECCPTPLFIFFVKYATVIILYCMIIWSKTILELTNLHKYIIVFLLPNKMGRKKVFISFLLYEDGKYMHREKIFLFFSPILLVIVLIRAFLCSTKREKKSQIPY